MGALAYCAPLVINTHTTSRITAQLICQSCQFSLLSPRPFQMHTSENKSATGQIEQYGCYSFERGWGT